MAFTSKSPKKLVIPDLFEAPVRNVVSRREPDPFRTQPTIDGAAAPQSPLAKKRKYTGRNSTSYSTTTYYANTIRKEQQHRRPSLGPRTPAQERRWQENARIKEVKRKLANLLEWHASCPASHAFPPEDESSEDEDPQEPRDQHRYHLVAPKIPSKHYDE